MNFFNHKLTHAMKPNAVLRRSQQRRTVRRVAYALLWLTVAGLILSVTACASQLPKQSTPPLKIPQPALREQQPSQTYLSRALGNISTWQKKLTDTQPMP